MHSKLTYSTLVCVSLALSACTKGNSSSQVREVDTGFHLDNVPELPSNTSRDFTCPIQHSSKTMQSGDSAIDFSTNSTKVHNILDKFSSPIATNNEFKITVIVVRRINGVPHYAYLSNGTSDDIFQAWSSTKFMAFAAMASQLRVESDGKMGIDGWTPDIARGGWVPVGDLVSFATSYRERYAPYTSNNVSTWAQNISGRPHSRSLIHNWLKRSTDEDFSGGYGETNSQLSANFEDQAGKAYSSEASSAGAGRNLLSTMTIAEFLKRLAMHRENSATALPHATWSDVQNIFYGALPEDTKYFSDKKMGGMAGGPSTYIHAAFDGWQSQTLASRTKGNHRTLTKIGWGPGPDDAPANDFVWHGYGCLPNYLALNADGSPTGQEFIISAALLGNDTRYDAASDALFRKAITAALRGINW